MLAVIFLFSLFSLILFFLLSSLSSSSSLPLSSLSSSSALSPSPSFGSLISFLVFKLLIAFSRSLIIPSLGLLVHFFSTIIPSTTSLNNPSTLNTCPIHFFFLLVIVSIRHLSSFTIVHTSSLLILSLHLIFLQSSP